MIIRVASPAGTLTDDVRALIKNNKPALIEVLSFKVIDYEPENLCEELLQSIALRHNIHLREMYVMPEHIHLSAEIPPSLSQSKALQLLKGGLSYQLFRSNKNFRLRYPKGHFFSPGALANSTGYTTVEVIDNYVKHQEDIHQKTLASFTGSPVL